MVEDAEAARAGPIQASIREFDDLIRQASTDPCILNREGVNPSNALRDLSVYLVTNSHILVAVWDGRRELVPGNTYDTMRMAIDGADPDVLQFASPKVPAARYQIPVTEHFVNSSEDCAIYWIKADRKKDAKPEAAEACIVGEVGTPCFVADVRVGTNKDPSEYIEFHDNRKTPVSKDIPPDLDTALGKLNSINEDLDRFEKHREKKNAKRSGRGSNPGGAAEGGRQSGPGFADYDPEALRESYYGLLPNPGSDSQEDREILESLKENRVMAEMAGRYAAIKELADVFRRRSRWSLGIIAVLTVVYTVFFNLLILFSTSILVVAIYGAIYLVCNVIIVGYDRTRIHPKFVEYRLLSDSLKVEFYWGLMGINDTVGSNSYVLTRNGMSWLRDVLRGCTSFFLNDYAAPNSIRPEPLSRLVQTNWVDGAVGSIGEQAGTDLRKNRIIGGVSDTFTVVTAVLTVITVLTVLLSIDQITEVVVNVTDPLNDASMQFSWYTFIKISMIVMINSAAILALRRGELRYTRANQAEASAVLFDSARSKLNATQHTSNRKAAITKMAVLHELGMFTLQESADFAVDSLEAGEAKRPTLLNSRNRTKDGEEGDAYKAAADMID